MAKTTQVTKLEDGDRRFTYQFYISEDATTADVTGTVVVDVSAMDPQPDSLVVTRINGGSIGGGGTLLFDRDTDQGVFAIPADSDFEADYAIRGANGWYDKGTGGTGDLIINTNGIDAAGDAISFIVEGRKKFA